MLENRSIKSTKNISITLFKLYKNSYSFRRQLFISSIIIKTSIFLNTFNLFQEFICLKLLSNKFHFVLCIEKFLFDFVKLIFKFSILACITIQLTFETGFKSRISLCFYFLCFILMPLLLN
jgi:hypothetical protein